MFYDFDDEQVKFEKYIEVETGIARAGKRLESRYLIISSFTVFDV